MNILGEEDKDKRGRQGKRGVQGKGEGGREGKVESDKGKRRLRDGSKAYNI